MRPEDYLVPHAQLQLIGSNLVARLRSIDGEPAGRSKVCVALSFVQRAKQVMIEPRSPIGSPNETSCLEMSNR